MSVYTIIKRDELENFLSHYSLGTLVEYEGIDAGIENTNYFVTSENGEFVLTIFEEIGFDALPYYLSYMAHLSDHGMPTAHPIADLNGDYVREFKGKPAAIVRRLEGNSVMTPTVSHCAAVGHALAQMHVVGDSFERSLQNPRGLNWSEDTASHVINKLPEDEQLLLKEEIEYRKQVPNSNLPVGVIHADLFRDNVMFKVHTLSGIIDFYYACNDYLLYDLAITVNDWCILDTGDIDSERYRSLINAYSSVRGFHQQEEAAWQYMLRAAALRFWLSRLKDKLFPKDGEITHIKDPDIFKKILLSRKHRLMSLCP